MFDLFKRQRKRDDSTPPQFPVDGQAWTRSNNGVEEVMVFMNGTWNLVPPGPVDPTLPFHPFDLVRMTNDFSRRPIFAGRLGAGRTYMRDFVAYVQNVLAICNVDGYVVPAVGEDYAKLKPLLAEPVWTIISYDFKPIDAYNFNHMLMKDGRIRTKTDGFRRGLSISNTHPNVLVASPEGNRARRIMFCADCEETYPTSYNVQDDLWNSVVPEKSCFLCLPCLEERVGRELTIDDFTPHEINTAIRFGYALGVKAQGESK